MLWLCSVVSLGGARLAAPPSSSHSARSQRDSPPPPRRPHDYFVPCVLVCCRVCVCMCVCVCAMMPQVVNSHLDVLQQPVERLTAMEVQAQSAFLLMSANKFF